MNSMFTPMLQDNTSPFPQTTAAPAAQMPAAQTPAGSPPANRNVDRNLEEFRMTFPHIYERVKHDPNSIPQIVWELVRQGMSLTNAFRFYLQHQQDLNQFNAQRAGSSMQCAGRTTPVTDPFLRGFDA